MKDWKDKKDIVEEDAQELESLETQLIKLTRHQQ